MNYLFARKDQNGLIIVCSTKLTLLLMITFDWLCRTGAHRQGREALIQCLCHGIFTDGLFLATIYSTFSHENEIQ